MITHPGTPPDSMWLAKVTSSLHTSNCHFRSPSTPQRTFPVWIPILMSTLNPVASRTNLKTGKCSWITDSGSFPDAMSGGLARAVLITLCPYGDTGATVFRAGKRPFTTGSLWQFFIHASGFKYFITGCCKLSFHFAVCCIFNECWCPRVK